MRASTRRTNQPGGQGATRIPRTIGWVLLAWLVLAVASVYAQPSAGVLLQSGLYKEDVNGDLEAAIKI